MSEFSTARVARYKKEQEEQNVHNLQRVDAKPVDQLYKEEILVLHKHYQDVLAFLQAHYQFLQDSELVNQWQSLTRRIYTQEQRVNYLHSIYMQNLQRAIAFLEAKRSPAAIEAQLLQTLRLQETRLDTNADFHIAAKMKLFERNTVSEQELLDELKQQSITSLYVAPELGNFFCDLNLPFSDDESPFEHEKKLQTCQTACADQKPDCLQDPVFATYVRNSIGTNQELMDDVKVLEEKRMKLRDIDQKYSDFIADLKLSTDKTNIQRIQKEMQDTSQLFQTTLQELADAKRKYETDYSAFANQLWATYTPATTTLETALEQPSTKLSDVCERFAEQVRLHLPMESAAQEVEKCQRQSSPDDLVFLSSDDVHYSIVNDATLKRMLDDIDFRSKDVSATRTTAMEAFKKWNDAFHAVNDAKEKAESVNQLKQLALDFQNAQRNHKLARIAFLQLKTKYDVFILHSMYDTNDKNSFDYCAKEVKVLKARNMVFTAESLNVLIHSCLQFPCSSSGNCAMNPDFFFLIYAHSLIVPNGQDLTAYEQALTKLNDYRLQFNATQELQEARWRIVGFTDPPPENFESIDFTRFANDLQDEYRKLEAATQNNETMLKQLEADLNAEVQRLNPSNNTTDAFKNLLKDRFQLIEKVTGCLHGKDTDQCISDEFKVDASTNKQVAAMYDFYITHRILDAALEIAYNWVAQNKVPDDTDFRAVLRNPAFLSTWNEFKLLIDQIH